MQKLDLVIVLVAHKELAELEFVLWGQQTQSFELLLYLIRWSWEVSNLGFLVGFQCIQNGLKNFSLLKAKKNWPVFLVLSENIYNRDSYLIPTPTVSKKMKHNSSTYITIPGKR